MTMSHTRPDAAEKRMVSLENKSNDLDTKRFHFASIKKALIDFR